MLLHGDLPVILFCLGYNSYTTELDETRELFFFVHLCIATTSITAVIIFRHFIPENEISTEGNKF